jgi:hypothetical protein
MDIAISPDRLVRFWRNVNKDGPTQPHMSTRCWIWTGRRTSGGYGSFVLDESATGAHRIAWLIHYGEIPPEKLICHHCDCRGCVRPGHLFAGTHQQNMADAVAKGRHPSARLSEDDVAEIRRILAARVTLTELAKRYGVDRRTIYCIERGLTHKGSAEVPENIEQQAVATGDS